MNENILFNDLEEIYTSRNDWDRLSNKTILLTGAYGMLASYVTYFINYLHEEKYREDAKKVLREDDRLKRVFHLE